jgi:hypothetical protein
MRKLAPMFITTSILALAAGNVLANNTTMGSTDKTGSPTVSDNTNKGSLSYSDKSNTAKGTNAKMDDKSVTGSATASTADKSASEKVNSQTTFATDEDKYSKKETSQRTEKDASMDSTAKPAKAKKAKVAKATHKDTVAKDQTVTDTGTEKMEKSPPLSATKGEAANSLTGKSAGQ